MKSAALVFFLAMEASLSANVSAGAGSASSSLQGFRYERALVGTVPMQEDCVPLGADVFEHAAPGLADLRVYRGSAEVPYTISEAVLNRASTATIAPLNLGDRGKEIAFDAAMPEGEYDDVELGVSATNFSATVTVTGSRTEADPHPTRLGDFTIFDLSAQKLGRSTVLHLPPSDFRFLHFRIVGPLTAGQLTGLSLPHTSAREPRYFPVQQSAHSIEKDHHTVIEFEVPAHMPVDRVLFAPGALPANFSRQVAVSVRASQPRPEARSEELNASTGTLLRLHTTEDGKPIDAEQLALQVEQDAAEQTDSEVSKWTVSVDNGDDAPLQFLSVELQMRERALCFTPEAAGGYTLFYGDPALKTPQYDYSALHQAPLDAHRATAGAERENPEYQPPRDQRPFTDRHPALLWSTLIGVIALLGSFALRSMREAK